MAAPYGNKNAEKWTFRNAVSLFKDAIKLSEQTEYRNIYNKDGEMIDSFKVYSYDFIGEIAKELGTFHHIFAHLSTRFPSLQRLRNQLINNLESNCYFNTKKGYIKEATGIVNLKSNHRWTDRNDLSSSDGSMTPKVVDLSQLSTEELLLRAKATNKQNG